MRIALARHDALLRQAIENNRGYVFKTVGDAFCAAFPTVPDALNAALAAQRALNAEPWSDTPIKTRMALHTGTAEEREGDYWGPPLNRVARLLSAGHGGQILLSAASLELTQDQLPQGVSILDLEEHRLKDLERPQRCFQLIAPGLPSDFPPLKTLDAFPNNLPIQLTSFIGREKEIEEIKRLLATTRLLTLTGSGGCGKTRLSLQIVADFLEDFADGVWFIELAPLLDPELVPQTIAFALDLRNQSTRPMLDTLQDYLKEKSLLLVLDNCEHLIDACAHLADKLLHATPQLQIIATSREGLGIAGEITLRVPSLALPNANEKDLGVLAQSEGVRLFMERARAAIPAFKLTNENAGAVAQMCRRLDGIPLAIELAAARLQVLSVEQIAARLDDRLRLLTGGSRIAPTRQQTLRGAIDWSYDLLSEQEKIFFDRLSVFAGGCSLEAIEFICADTETRRHGNAENEIIPSPRRQSAASDALDLLSSLVDKSLVVMNEHGADTRYSMLETIRQYAREKLQESGEEKQVRDHHLEFFLKLAEEAEPKYFGPEQSVWFNRIESDHDNLRAALDWSLQSRNGTAALRLAAALERFWYVCNHISEGYGRLRQVLSQPETAARTAERAKALNSEGFFHWEWGNYAEMRRALEEALEIGERLGDKRTMIKSLLFLGIAVTNLGDYNMASTYLERGLLLSREWGDVLDTGKLLTFLGEVAFFQREYERAQMLYDEAEPLVRESSDQTFLAYLLRRLGQAARYRGDYQQATARYKECLVLSRGFAAAYLIGFTTLARNRKQMIHAAKLFGAIEVLLEPNQKHLTLADRVDYERILVTVRAHVDEATFAAALAEGRLMTLEQAIAEAEQITASEQSSPAPLNLVGLTEREIEVLRLLARGLSNQQIADDLVLSKRTVEAHLRSIFSKLDVTTRSAATRAAIENKIV